MSAYLKQLVECLNYTPINNVSSKYSKTYKDDYTITIDFNSEKIDYPAPMTLGDKTTCHFVASENFVVLECVNRLLEKGYKPENITLEKKWGLGHKDKGKADVLICHPKKKNGNGGKPFLIIECKTIGAEFEKEFNKTLSNGGQLLSYYQQEQQTELLCLYTSAFEDGEVRYTNRIIKIEEAFKGKSKAETFKTWKEEFGLEFKYNGIFDDEAKPYNVELKPLKRKDLVHLQAGDSGYIYNQFAEILRHNVVSDKPNAFNKMFNLILAKFLDEDREPNEILEFQWLETDDDITLQKRLNDLYKRGMKDYLNKQVTDFSDEEQQTLLGNRSNLSPHLRERLKKIFTELRLYKNNEFSFKEVFNEKSFSDNAIVVKETVKLLQAYQLRYSHKQQFLSNFFELLLSNTLKQEAGQFFTPVPIAKFIVSSIPLKEITERKIKQGKNEFLPYIIDFAAGSGHFLTEAMDELQHVVESLPLTKVKPSVKNRLINWQNVAYEWARDYIYGIEKDYRLAKIAKVSCFLSGDGLANIIHADGLDSFDSDEYADAPLLHTKRVTKENQKFDVLAANPPYSVQAFIKTLPKGHQCFDLFNDFTEQSKEIEVLFIERAKQLLADGGFAGIILPSSILNNTGTYTRAREILLKFFRVVAIVEFGSSTFMATGTNTIALFLERRSNLEHSQITSVIERFFNDRVDTDCNGIENAFSRYAEFVHQISLDDYISFVARDTNATFKNTELYHSYEKWYASLSSTKSLNERISKQRENLEQLRTKTTKTEKKAFSANERVREIEEEIKKAESDIVRLFYERVSKIEQDKMLYFFLALPQNVLLIKSTPTGDSEKEKEFLGYKFSDRRGHEGITMFTDANGVFTTKLYNGKDHRDAGKVNSYIYRAFLNEPLNEIDESLSDNIQEQNLAEMINFDRVELEKEISLSVKKKVDFDSVWGSKNLVPLSAVADIQKGTSITKVSTIKGSVPVVAGGKEAAYFHNVANRKGNIITVSASGAYSGFISYWERPIYASDCNTIASKDENEISTKLIYYFLRSVQDLFYSLQRGATTPHVYAYDIEKVKIPFPPKPVQEKITQDFNTLEQKEKSIKERLAQLNSQLNNLFASDSYPLEKLGNLVDFKNGLNYSKESAGDLVTIIGVKDFLDHFSPNLDKLVTVRIDGKLSESYKLQSGDILVVRSNGSANLVGRFIYIDQLREDTSYSGFTVRIRAKSSEINSKYLCYCLRTEKVRNAITTDPKGANIKSVNQTMLSSISIPLPQPEEQIQIMRRAEELEKEIATVKQHLESIETEKEQVLKKYLVE